MARRPIPRPPPPSRDRPVKNRLIAALPSADFQRLQPEFTVVPIKVKQILQKQGDPIRHVYFPNGGVISVTNVMKNGETVEVATVGDEGLIGIEAFWGARVMPGETMVQVPDTDAIRMTLKAFTRELDRREAFHDGVRRYSQVLLAQIMQSAACMAFHHVQERCCRWLLMTHDRVRRDQFELSHEFLGMMLGATRPTVTAVAGSLQRAGLIRYTHARITVLNRQGLEAASCECYATIRDHIDRLGLTR